MNENELKKIIRSRIELANCPGLLRLAFHDAGTYRHHDGSAGVSGSVTTEQELSREKNDALDRPPTIVNEIKHAHPAYSIAILCGWSVTNVRRTCASLSATKPYSASRSYAKPVSSLQPAKLTSLRSSLTPTKN
jgi:hypothetical protein